MTRKKWINAKRVGPEKYWYCPGKCGRAHMSIADEGEFTCKECGFSYYIYDVQGLRILIEEKNETKS